MSSGGHGHHQLYNEVQSVILKTGPNEEKNCQLRITVDSKVNHTTKLLNIKVTDDVDYTFLFTLVLTQEDFLILKAQQGLRVDFENFHRHLPKLLIDCNSAERPQFALMLDDSDGNTNSILSSGGLFLKVIERNEFKYLCHLSLRLAPASDDDVKQHLCSKLKIFQDQISCEQMKSHQMETELNRYAELLSQKTQELKDMEVRHAKESSTIRLNCSQEVTNERTKHSNEIVELEAKHHGVLHDLQEQIRLLNYRNTTYHEEKCSLQSSLKEMTLLKENASKELSKLLAEFSDQKSAMTSLEHRAKNSEQRLEMANKRLCAVETSEKETVANLCEARREIQIVREREAAINANLSRCQRQLHHTIDQLSQATKAKDRCEHELSAKRSKLEKMLIVATKLENELETAHSEIELKNNSLTALEIANKECVLEIATLKKQLGEVENKLKLQEETLKKQVDVNAYLHRKLNDATSGSMKNASLSASAVASLYPCSVNGIDSVRSSGNRSIVPWMANMSKGANTTLVEQSATLPEQRSQLRLDPSYLSPADTERLLKISDAKSTRNKESAYFPKKLS